MSAEKTKSWKVGGAKGQNQRLGEGGPCQLSPGSAEEGGSRTLQAVQGESPALQSIVFLVNIADHSKVCDHGAEGASEPRTWGAPAVTVCGTPQ